MFKKLWADEAYFKATLRGLVAMLGALAASGMLPTGTQGSVTGKLGWTLGWVALAGSQFISSSRKNGNGA